MSDISTIFKVWNKQGDGYVSVPRKLRSADSPKGSKNHAGKWEEKTFEWPADIEDIKQYIRESHKGGYDLYWCPSILEKNRRVKDSISKMSVLYADLDEVKPESIPDNLRPSVAWESSPGRYAAVWFMDKPLSATEAENTNKSLTYFIGADKGGWDLTQVLRIPGTRNFKYNDGPAGKLLWHEDKNIELSNIPILPNEKDPLEVEETLIDSSPDRLLSVVSTVKDKLKPKTLSMLIASDDEIMLYDRSEKLWELECQLIEQGISPQKALELVACSNWNKYRGRRDEMRRLQSEIDKVLSHTAKPNITKPERSFEKKWTTYSDLMSMQLDQPGWMIEGVWQRTSHGMIAGEPKTYKSVIATDMAVSVASGKPFLGKFAVKHQGPVMYIQEENSPWLVKDRVMKVATTRGALDGKAELWANKLKVQMPQDLPLYFLNNMGFDFTNEEDRNFLEESIKEIKPVLMIFDPLYLMLGEKDENSSKDIRPVLNWLLSLRYTYGTSVIILHHWNKAGKSDRGGQRMLGSVLFHGWVESAMYTRVVNEQNHQIEVEREFRSFSKPDPLNITFNFGEPGDDYYDARIAVGATHSNNDAVLEFVKAQRVNLDEVISGLHIKSKEAQTRLNKLVKDGLISVSESGIYSYNYKEDNNDNSARPED